MLLMLFIFLCFAGQCVMFFFILHGQEKSHRQLCEECAQLRHALRQLEARLAGTAGDVAAQPPLQGRRPEPARLDTLDSLSMGDEPPAHGAPADNGLELHFDPQEYVRR